MTRLLRQARWAVVLGCLLLGMALLPPPPAWAGAVDWREVPASAEGRQSWDAGSLRVSRNGTLTVLSRFQPVEPPPDGKTPSQGRPSSMLYVMELDCGQELYRDTSVNGFPRFRADWQVASGDSLSLSILRESCHAGADLLARAAPGDAGHG